MPEAEPPITLPELLRLMRAKHWREIAQAARLFPDVTEREEEIQKLQIELVTGLTAIEMTQREKERVWGILNTSPDDVLPYDVVGYDLLPPQPTRELPEPSTDPTPQPDPEPELKPESGQPSGDIQKGLF